MAGMASASGSILSESTQAPGRIGASQVSQATPSATMRTQPAVARRRGEGIKAGRKEGYDGIGAAKYHMRPWPRQAQSRRSASDSAPCCCEWRARRSEERRVGKEGRSGGWGSHEEKKTRWGEMVK